MGAAAVVAAAAARRKREIVDRFVEAGAVSPERAVSLADIGVEPHTRMTRELFHEEIIRTTADGAFWVDLARASSLRRARLRLVGILVAVMLLVLLVVAWLGALTR